MYKVNYTHFVDYGDGMPEIKKGLRDANSIEICNSMVIVLSGLTNTWMYLTVKFNHKSYIKLMAKGLILEGWL